ncbi:MAG TPA: MBL fold metallo-hydrolase, partial [Casimicrobiaceae bacterium]
MRFASIGSGSEGNGLIVEAGTTRVLIDCGFGVRDTAQRLARIGVEPESLTAILVTHEHNDHVGGVPAFAARYEIPVWLTFGTLA